MSDASARWQRLQDIVQSALHRPVEKRAAFLAEACGGDMDLQREAASLVAQDDRASGFLATPLAELAAVAVTYSPAVTTPVEDTRDLIGTRLGAYEIRTRLGAGGMGEVYRAHDHSLHRDVAIKVLPAAFATDSERLVRFEREARLLASLNHPHIGAVYGVAGDGNLRGIVLELIEGETLEARLAKGPVPLSQVLTFALQIARALDHAHQHGVMHRDLKPANIMLTKSGTKLLDFGLAKWSAPRAGYSPSSGSASARPEGVESVTSEGAILGTLNYMAPEQLEGKKVDARADVFAFGAVLYEILIGHRAFDGGSATAVMAAVINTEPAALDTVKRLASPSIERIVRKSLAKDPEDRWQTARDLADELKWVTDDAARPSSPAFAPVQRTGWTRWPTIAAVGLGLALAGWTGWRVGSADDPPATRAIVRFPVLPSGGARVFGFDISADGTKLVFETGGPLFLRQLDQPTDVPIPGTKGGGGPFFSPNGQWVAYFSEGRLLKVNVQEAAAPILLMEGVDSWFDNGSVWLDDGRIVVGRKDGGLLRVADEGGESQALTSLIGTPPEFDHHGPSLLPGGQAVLFTSHDASGFKLVAEVLATKERKVLMDSAFDGRYVPTGHLVFARERAILAAPFDLRRLEVTGPAVNLVENVAGAALDGYGGYRLSSSGTLVFRPAPSITGRKLVWVDRKGIETPLPISARAVSGPSVSRDGRRLAIAVADGGRRDIWTYEFATEKLSRLTREGDNWAPLWTKDGKRLVFASKRGGSPALFWQDADGGSKPEQIVAGDVDLHPGGWSADGSLVYADGGAGPEGTSMYTVSLEGNRQPTPRRHGPGSQRSPRVSPDGRWVAYYSSETGRAEVFVSDLPDFTTHRQVTTEGGHSPEWSPNGQELTYRFNARMFSVPITKTSSFSSGKPRQLFASRYVLDFQPSYDVAPDGRWVMIKPDPEEVSSLGLQVVLNWVDELVRRVPTGQ